MSPPPRLELLPLNVAPASCRMLPTPDASTAPPPPRADNAPVMVKPCAVTLPPSNTAKQPPDEVVAETPSRVLMTSSSTLPKPAVNNAPTLDRQRVVVGRSAEVRVELGGRCLITQKSHIPLTNQ